MEEERQARARVPEPRVPVVSRPTAARTQHMAEIAKTLSIRQSCSDDHGRVLCPSYPVSTVNAPVPSVLAEALLQGAVATGGGREGDAAMEATAREREKIGGSSRNQASRGSSKGGMDGAVARRMKGTARLGWAGWREKSSQSTRRRCCQATFVQ